MVRAFCSGQVIGPDVKHSVVLVRSRALQETSEPSKAASVSQAALYPIVFSRSDSLTLKLAFGHSLCSLDVYKPS